MKENLIKTLMVNPLEKPKIAYIPNSSKYFDKLINQDPYFTENAEIIILEDGVGVLRNKKGALLDLKGNRKIGNEIIAGRFFVIGIQNNGRVTSLPKDKITKYINRFSKAEYYTDTETINSYWDRFEEDLFEELFD